MTCKRCGNVARRAGLCDKHHEASPYHGYVDAAPTKARLAELHDAGWAWEAIAESAGLTPQGVYNLRDATNVVQRFTATVIADLPIDGGTGMIPAIGLRRRAQALACMGWSHASLGRRLGIQRGPMRQMIYRNRVFIDRAKAVDALYQELSMVDGPSSRTRAFAQAQGWAPPAAWDDDTIDDPNATPQHNAHRFVPFAELYVEARYHCRITDLTAIAEKLDQEPESVKRQVERRKADIAALRGIAS